MSLCPCKLLSWPQTSARCRSHRSTGLQTATGSHTSQSPHWAAPSMCSPFTAQLRCHFLMRPPDPAHPSKAASCHLTAHITARSDSFPRDSLTDEGKHRGAGALGSLCHPSRVNISAPSWTLPAGICWNFQDKQHREPHSTPPPRPGYPWRLCALPQSWVLVPSFILAPSGLKDSQSQV